MWHRKIQAPRDQSLRTEQYWPRVVESGTTPEMSQWKPAHTSFIETFTTQEKNK